MPSIYRIVLKGINSKFPKYEMQETRPREQPREKWRKWMGVARDLKKETSC